MLFCIAELNSKFDTQMYDRAKNPSSKTCIRFMDKYTPHFFVKNKPITLI